MTPYAHQNLAVERFRDRAYGALFLEQGLGKSKIAIDIAEAKFTKGEITGVLVVCPKSLIDNWVLEINKHSLIACPEQIYPWRKKKLSFAPSPLKPSWFVANIDAVITEPWIRAFRAFTKVHTKFALIIDESTTCKTPKSQRTLRMLQVADYAKCRFILSGAPITNSPLDIWAQAELLRPGLAGGTFFQFKQHYAITEKVSMWIAGQERSFIKIKEYRNLEELTEKIKTFAVIAKKEDCLDLPPKIYQQVPIEFTTEQTKHYKELKALALTTIDDQKVTAVNAVSLINSLLQICAGQLKLPDGSYHYLETERLGLLADLLDESAEKGLIWCSFIGAADAVERALGSRIMRIRAETPPEERQNLLDEYERAEGTPALLLNQASMGKGITILEGRNMIYYSQRFSVEQRVQSEDRPHRIGQTKSVLISELYTPGTVEEKVINVLRTNRELANRIITNRDTLREFIA